MTYQEVSLVYPNRWREYLGESESGDDEGWCWFLFSQRILDSKTGLYYSQISDKVQFYDPETGKSFRVKKRTRDHATPRLLIASDPHNREMLPQLRDLCDSGKEILSHECRITGDLKSVTKKASQIGFDGVVIRRDSHERKKGRSFDLSRVLCPTAVFCFKKKCLGPLTSDGRCWIVRYAKLHNTRIREKITDFPTCSEIDEELKEKKCEEVARELYESLS